MVISNNFNNSFDELMFNHKMECMYIEQSFINEILRIRYKGINESTNTEIIQESVLETIKKAILEVIRKIKDLFVRIITFIKNDKEKKELNDEIKKAEDIISDKPIDRIKKDLQNNNDTKNDQTPQNLKIPSQIVKKQTIKPRKMILYFNDNRRAKQMVLFNTLNNCKLYKKIIEMVDIYKVSNNNAALKSLDKDIQYYANKKEVVNEFISDFYLKFYSNMTGGMGGVFSGVELDEDKFSFPTIIKDQLTYDMNIKRYFECYGFQKYKERVKQEIEYAKDSLKTDSENDFDKCKSCITKLENDIKRIQNANDEQIKNLLTLVRMLSTLINNTIPEKIKFDHQLLRNSKCNLRMLNALVMKYNI